MTDILKINSLGNYDGIEVFNVCDVLDFLGVHYWQNNGYATLQEFCQKNNLDYYAAPREYYSEWVAVADAKRCGYWGVVVEDLS